MGCNASIWNVLCVTPMWHHPANKVLCICPYKTWHFTCVALSNLSQKEWKIEQHSSSLNAAGSSQKYSATEVLMLSSSWREASTSASRMSAICTRADIPRILIHHAVLPIMVIIKITWHYTAISVEETFLKVTWKPKNLTQRNASIWCSTSGCLLASIFASLIFSNSFWKSISTSCFWILYWIYEQSGILILNVSPIHYRTCILPTLQQFQCVEAVQGNAAKLHQSVGLAVINRKWSTVTVSIFFKQIQGINIQ